MNAFRITAKTCGASARRTSVHGYTAWGGPPPQGPIDGSIVPCATGGSLPFLYNDCMRVLRNIRGRYRDKAWGRYGFVDAFNPLTGWYDPDVIGHRSGHHDADGRKSTHRFCVGDLHEKPRSASRHAKSRIPLDVIEFGLLAQHKNCLRISREGSTPTPFFLQVWILKDFKSCVLEVRILNKLWASFAEVRILKDLVNGDPGFVAAGLSDRGGPVLVRPGAPAGIRPKRGPEDPHPKRDEQRKARRWRNPSRLGASMGNGSTCVGGRVKCFAGNGRI